MTTSTPPRLVRALLVLCALAALLAGCGESDNPTEDAYGEMSEADTRKAKDLFAAQSKLTKLMVQYAEVEAAQDVVGMRTKADAMMAEVNRSADLAADLENAKFRDVMVRSADAQKDALDALDAFVAYYEEDGPVDEELEKRLLEDVETTAAKSEKVGYEFLNAMKRVMSDEQAAEIDEQLEKHEEQIDSAYE